MLGLDSSVGRGPTIVLVVAGSNPTPVNFFVSLSKNDYISSQYSYGYYDELKPIIILKKMEHNF